MDLISLGDICAGQEGGNTVMCMPLPLLSRCCCLFRVSGGCGAQGMDFLVSVEHAGLWGAEFGGFLCVSGACWDLGSRVFGVSGRCWAPGTGFSM